MFHTLAVNAGSRLLDKYRAAYSGHSRSMWQLALALLVNRAGTMVLPFASLFLADERGLSAGEVSVVLLAFGLGSVAGSFLGGIAVTRVGPRATMITSLIGVGVAFVLFGQAESYGSLVCAAAAVSTIGDAFRPAAMVQVSRLASMERIVQAQALARSMINLGVAIGPAVGGFLAAVNYDLLFWGDALTGWLSIPLVWFAGAHGSVAGAEQPKPVESSGPSGDKASLTGNLRVCVFLGLTFIVALVIFQGIFVLPLYLKRVYLLAESEIGLLLGIQPAFIALFEMALVEALHRRNSMRIYALGALLTGLGLALLELRLGVAWAAFSMAVWSVGEMTTIPFGSGMVARLAEGGNEGRYFGWYSTTFAVAQVIAGPLGMTVQAQFGWLALWLGVLAAGVVVGAVALWVSPSFSFKPGS